MVRGLSPNICLRVSLRPRVPSHPSRTLPRRPVPTVIKAASRMEANSPSTPPQIAYSNVFAKFFRPTVPSVPDSPREPEAPQTVFGFPPE